MAADERTEHANDDAVDWADEEHERTPYTLTERDIEGCRAILAQLRRHDEIVGDYTVSNIQAHPGSATATVKFSKRPGPAATWEGIDLLLDAAPRLGLVCKKVVAHWKTNMAEGDGG